MIDISFIIVNWNARNYLSKCLESMRTYVSDVSWETIVVDNGSEDGSQEMIHTRFPWVRLIETGENLGFARANNIGMKHSNGRFICLVNSDIEFGDNCILPMIQYMEEHRDVGILGPALLNRNHTLQKSHFSFPSVTNTAVRAFALDYLWRYISTFGGLRLKTDNNDAIISVDALSGAFLLIRREAYEVVGGFDENIFMYSEDIDLAKRYHESGWDLIYYPHANVVHYGGGSSVNDPVRFYLEQQRARIYFINKHYSLTRHVSIYCTMLFYNMLRLFFWGMIYLFLRSRRSESFKMIERYYKASLWLCGNRSA